MARRWRPAAPTAWSSWADRHVLPWVYLGSPASRRLLDFVGVDERQKRTLSATVGGLIGSVVAGFALNALIDDPMVV